MSISKVTNAEIIAAFNKLKTKPNISLKDLQSSKQHKVLSLFRHKTKYGNVVIAELEDTLLYLPKQYNNLNDNVIEGVANKKFTLTKKLENNNNVLELEKSIIVAESEKDIDETFFIPNSQPFFSWESPKVPRII